jgi:hypothetical protein
MPVIWRAYTRLTDKRAFIFLIAYGSLVFLYSFLPRDYQLPRYWDLPVFVALAWSGLLLLLWPPFWRQARFWAAVAIGAFVQVWAMEEWLRRGHSAMATGRNFGTLGWVVWAVSYWVLWRTEMSLRSSRDDFDGGQPERDEHLRGR